MTLTPEPLVLPLEPAMADLLAMVATMPPMESLPPAVAREIFRQQSAVPPGTPEIPMQAVQELAARGPGGAIPIRLYRPRGAGGLLPVLMFVHGGGWVIGDLDSYDRCCRTLALESGMAVASVDYRLAPEHRFPAAVDDVEAALRWLSANAHALDCHPLRLALVGDSAGAQLAATAALRCAGTVPVAALGLIYPPAHAWSVPTASKTQNGQGKILTSALIEHFARLYLGDALQLHGHPDAVLLGGRPLSDLPPTWLATLGHDPLRDDGLALVSALSQAGVPVRHVHEPAGVHGCLTMPAAVSKVGPQLLAGLAAWLRETV